MEILWLIYWGTTKCFQQRWQTLFYIPTSNVQRYHFLCTLANICYFPFFKIRPFLWLRSFILLCIFLMTNDVDHLFMCSLFMVHLLRNVYSSPLLSFLTGLSFCCCYERSLCKLWLLGLYQRMICEYSPPLCMPSFYFLDHVLWRINILILLKSSLSVFFLLLLGFWNNI